MEPGWSAEEGSVKGRAKGSSAEASTAAAVLPPRPQPDRSPQRPRKYENPSIQVATVRHAAATDEVRFGSSPGHIIDGRREARRRETGGVIDVPGRILATLQRKFWDSNKIVSDSAVLARDLLAEFYLASKDRAAEVAGAAIHNTLQAYKFARDHSTAMELPGPLKPVRDLVLVPSFRGVERSVEFVLSPRLGEAYHQLKEHGANIPLLGRSIFLPSVEVAEGVARFVLVVVQAPLPSAESVANVAEVSMNLGKRGVRVAFRELYYYMELIDHQVTRTMTRAQWDILGNGPYANLARDRREEVMDRACEKYLSLEHPIQRYEFLAQIRWHNAALHDDLVQTGTLRARADVAGAGGGGDGKSASPSPFAGDAWLDPNAVWRRTAGASLRYLEGVVMEGVHEQGVGWFWRTRSALGGEGGSSGPWKAFSARECWRLERAFRRKTSVLNRRESAASSPGGATTAAGTQEPSSCRVPRTSARTATSSERPTSPTSASPRTPTPRSAEDDDDESGLCGGEDSGGVKEGTSVAYQPMQGVVLGVCSYEVQPDDVLVDQGRHAVTLDEMVMRPVFWPFSGQAAEVCRAVWVQDTGTHLYPRPAHRQRGVVGSSEGGGGGEGGLKTDRRFSREDEGPVGLEPYPLRASAILEDAYQFLAWHLGDTKDVKTETAVSKASSSAASHTVLLTVQVSDQLVQFRSLSDIVCVKRTLGGAFSVFGRRRVFRGVPAPERSLDGATAATASSESSSISPSSDAASATASTTATGPAPSSPQSMASPSRRDPSTSGVAGSIERKNEPLLCAVSSLSNGGGSSESATAVGAGVPRHGELFADDRDGDHGGGVGKRGGGGGGHGVEGAVGKEFEGKCGGSRAEGPEAAAAARGVTAEEDEEETLRDLEADLDERVEHLVLVVHGIGNALMSVDLGMVQLQSLVECCDTMRANHEEVVLNSKHLRVLRRGDLHGRTDKRRRHMDSGKKHRVGVEKQERRGRRSGIGRVEYLPVEWHTRFKGRLYREVDEPATAASSGFERQRKQTAAVGSEDRESGRQGSGDGESGLRKCAQEQGQGVGEGGRSASAGALSIWDITLPRAPNLRAFTNDTLLDILYFMSPEYHQVIVEEVTGEINRVLALFRKQTRSWSGKVSIVAHSLGAIICFDIMANQRPDVDVGTQNIVDINGHPKSNTSHAGEGNAAASGNVRDDRGIEEGERSGNAGRNQTFPQVSARVENVFCLGSPIGMFLMIRGQHRGLGKGFKLPGCRRLFNIFHPYDPVAFRLEPLLRANDGVPRGDQGQGGKGTARVDGRTVAPLVEEPVILPTWTGGLRVQYQVQRWWQDLWSRAWEAKTQAELSIERSLEAIGLIDEQHDDDGDDRAEESLFSSASDVAFGAVECVLEEVAVRAKATEENYEARSAAIPGPSVSSVFPVLDNASVDNARKGSSSAPIERSGLSHSQAGAATPAPTLLAPAMGRTVPHDPTELVSSAPPASYKITGTSTSASIVVGEDDNSERGDAKAPSLTYSRRELGDNRSVEATAPAEQEGDDGASTREFAGLEWMRKVMEEDVGRNGALAGGRRVDYCLQEKEFEVTNEYIFALGSHMIYWSSKDVSLFVAQQVVVDAVAADTLDAVSRPGDSKQEGRRGKELIRGDVI